MKLLSALVIIAALANTANTAKAAPTTDSTPRVEVKGPRVHAKDIFPGAAVDVDLGPTPPIGSTRVIEKAEIEKAYAEAKVLAPKKIPPSVRISRRTRKLSALDLGNAIKATLATQKLPRGAELIKVRATATEVADDYHHVNVDVPAVPRRAGPTTVQATVTFMSADSDTPIYRAVVPLDIALPAEAAFADITKGSPITIVVKKGLVEVSMPGVAALDADIGGIVPVTLKPSGRVVRCRAVDKTHAVAEES